MHGNKDFFRKNNIDIYKHQRSVSVNPMQDISELRQKVETDRTFSSEDESLQILKRHNKTQSHKENYLASARLTTISSEKMGKFNRFIFRKNVDGSAELTFEQAKNIELLFQQRNLNAFYQFIFALMSIVSGAAEYEITFEDNKGKYGQYAIFCLVFCTLSTILLGICTVLEFVLKNKIKSFTERLSESIWTKEKNNLSSLVISLVLLSIHPNILFYASSFATFNNKYQIRISYSLNSLLLVFLLLRLWYFVKFLVLQSEFSSDRGQRICEMNGFSSNIMFSLKANMKKNPITFYCIFFLIILVYHSYLLRIFERGLDPFTDNNFSNLWNSTWCLMITMVTVGFGDLFPSTFLGRIIGISGCIFGAFLISLSIITITNVFIIEGAEKNIYLLLKRVKLLEEKDCLAKKLITLYLKAIRLMRSSKLKEEEVYKKEAVTVKEKVLLNLYYFREVERQMNMTYAISQEEEILDSFDFIEDKIEELKEQVNAVEENFRF